jgi:ABC-type transport system involved in multi-copper enzyme maturation permease subunit
MFPLLVFAEFGAFLEFAAFAFFIGSLSRSGAMVLGVLITMFFIVTLTVLILGIQFGEQESMFLLPIANGDFLVKVIPWYIVQPWGVMVLQGYGMGVGYTLPVVVTVSSALQFALAGLVVTIVAPLVAGYYFFRRAEIKG